MKKSKSLLLIFILIFTLFACEDKITNPYVVNFLNDNGNLLYSTTVYENDYVTYNGEIPTKESSNTQNFEFNGWLYNGEHINELPKIKDDTVFVASYTATTRTYEIIFDINGIEYSEFY